MSYDNKPKFPPRKKGPLDNDKLNLNAPCPTAQGKYSKLTWGLHSNNPRITVFTNDPADISESTGYGKITANLDSVVLFTFLDTLEAMANSKVKDRRSIQNKGYTWFGGKRSENKVTLSTLSCGKDDDGIVWMSVVAATNRPKIKFPFELSDYHVYLKEDGSEVSKSEGSVMAALALVKLLRAMYTHMMVTEYVEPPAKTPPPAGGYQAGGKPGAKAAAVEDEDIPW
jgi:hypothetical protein